ncbi:carbamoyl-phosphate synthase L chain, N-terminal domain protein, partial [Chlamydia psittaci 84-8471/1]
PWQIKKLYTCS